MDRRVKPGGDKKRKTRLKNGWSLVPIRPVGVDNVRRLELPTAADHFG